MQIRKLIFPLLCLSLLAAAPAPATAPAAIHSLEAAALHYIEDMFLLRDLHFECSDFSYDSKTKTITARNVALIPDDGPARVAARNGKPPFPKLKVAVATVGIARDPNPDAYPSPVVAVLENPVVPLSPAEAAATQPTFDLHFVVWTKMIASARASDWTELFHRNDGSDPLDGYPDLRELTVNNFIYETTSNMPGKPATLLLSAHIKRDTPTHWTGELKATVRIPQSNPLGPLHFELKSEEGKLLVRCTDPPNTQPATQPTTRR